MPHRTVKVSVIAAIISPGDQFIDAPLVVYDGLIKTRCPRVTASGFGLRPCEALAAQLPISPAGPAEANETFSQRDSTSPAKQPAERCGHDTSNRPTLKEPTAARVAASAAVHVAGRTVAR